MPCHNKNLKSHGWAGPKRRAGSSCLQRTLLYALCPALLCYCALGSQAALQGDAPLSTRKAYSLHERRLPLPHLPAIGLSATFETMWRDLRHLVAASGLMHDTRPAPEQERLAYVALWSDLEPAPTQQAAPDPILLPGQD